LNSTCKKNVFWLADATVPTHFRNVRNLAKFLNKALENSKHSKSEHEGLQYIKDNYKHLSAYDTHLCGWKIAGDGGITLHDLEIDRGLNEFLVAALITASGVTDAIEVAGAQCQLTCRRSANHRAFVG